MRLICAAVIEELQPLLKLTEFEQKCETLFIHREKSLLVAAFGVGLVDFACGFQALLAEYAIDEAVLTGTCGVYHEALADWPIGTVVAPETVTLGDFAVVNGSGYFPAPITQSLFLNHKIFNQLVTGIGGHCLTLSSITSDDHTAERIAGHYKADFEQMEAYAFARVCQVNAISGAALLAAVNRVGSSGHKQWLENAPQGSLTAAKIIQEFFLF